MSPACPTRSVPPLFGWTADFGAAAGAVAALAAAGVAPAALAGTVAAALACVGAGGAPGPQATTRPLAAPDSNRLRAARRVRPRLAPPRMNPSSREWSMSVTPRYYSGRFSRLYRG